MKSTDLTFNNFKKKNEPNFILYLNSFAADRILLSPVALFLILALCIFSILNIQKFGAHSGIAYIPTIFLFIVFKVLFELGFPVKRFGMQWTESIAISIFVGFNFILWEGTRSDQASMISSNGSMSIIFITTAMLTMTKNNLEMACKSLAYISIEIIHLYLIKPQVILDFKMELISGLGFILTIGYLKNMVLQMYFYHTETRSASLMHAYDQLQKLVFPHQLDLMKLAYSLEDSMPVGSGPAVVICYDIQNSTQMPQTELNIFIQKIMEACHEVFSEGYCRSPLQLTAFKLKEMGDGFICTIGYPFIQPDGLSAYETALKVAFECQKITSRVRQELNLNHGYCSIGIASGILHSFYTRVGIKVYDVFGDALVLAKRYEEFRKQYQLCQPLPMADIIAVQATTLEACSLPWQSKFERIDLDRLKLKVRDETSAKHLYLAVIEEQRRPNRVTLQA